MNLPRAGADPAHGYALQCRVTTEDPENNSSPITAGFTRTDRRRDSAFVWTARRHTAAR